MSRIPNHFSWRFLILFFVKMGRILILIGTVSAYSRRMGQSPQKFYEYQTKSHLPYLMGKDYTSFKGLSPIAANGIYQVEKLPKLEKRVGNSGHSVSDHSAQNSEYSHDPNGHSRHTNMVHSSYGHHHTPHPNGWGHKEEEGDTIDKLWGTIGPLMFPLPFFLWALPLAIPAIPLSWYLSVRGGTFQVFNQAINPSGATTTEGGFIEGYTAATTEEY